MSIATALQSLTKYKPVAAVVNFMISALGHIKWPLSRKHRLNDEDIVIIRELLKKDYYIIASRNSNHLSAYMVSFGSMLLTGKPAYWGHVFMNLEDEVRHDDDFRFVEAVAQGVKFSPFDEVFACTGAALLKPKNITLKAWTELLDEAAETYVGRPYDNLFNLASDSNLSCVELVRDILSKTPDYDKNFAAFEQMIATEKNLTPQMFYDCSDFEVVYEARR